MKGVLAGIVIAVAAVCSCAALGQDAKPNAQSDSTNKAAIDRWVRELGDPNFIVRDSAQKRLIEAGEAARAALDAATKSKDLEQRLRAEHILAELRRRDVWAPTLITYKADKVTPNQVLKSIEELTGNKIDWNRTAPNMPEKVTINWQSMPVWSALADLCTKAKLEAEFPESGKQTGWIVGSAEDRLAPIAVDGPLRMQVSEMNWIDALAINPGDKEAAKKKQLEVLFLLNWEQRFPLCRYDGKLRVIEAVTDTGEDLKYRPSNQINQGVLNKRQLQISYLHQLRPATKPFKALKSLVVDVDLVAAGDFAQYTVPVGLKPATKQHAGYTFEFLGISRAGSRHELAIRLTRPTPYDGVNAMDMIDEYYTVADSAGKDIPYQFHQVFGDKGSAKYVFQCPENSKPVTVTAHISLLKSRKTVRFSFANVVVPEETKKPAKD